MLASFFCDRVTRYLVPRFAFQPSPHELSRSAALQATREQKVPTLHIITPCMHCVHYLYYVCLAHCRARARHAHNSSAFIQVLLARAFRLVDDRNKKKKKMSLLNAGTYVLYTSYIIYICVYITRVTETLLSKPSSNRDKVASATIHNTPQPTLCSTTVRTNSNT